MSAEAHISYRKGTESGKNRAFSQLVKLEVLI